ncbi:G-protein coupled receptor Mth2-like [Musca autumnalis]|uniref:G-protein coupled receptor Mth2-like n=1 Tax=Musca autumnalis TaxID=221902 RepID=UPI003CF6A710
MGTSHIISVIIFTMTMLFIACIGLFLVPALIAREEANDIKREMCNFRDTVDLTNRTRFPNGSYLYDGILIPANQSSFYKNRVMFLDKSQPAELHMRGCICNATEHRYCTKLCCDRGQFFNRTSGHCEKLPLPYKMPRRMEIGLEDNSRKNINIFDHFIIQIGKPCAKLEVISMKEDPWLLMEDGNLTIESEKAVLDTVNYCLSPQYNNESKRHQLTAMSCPMKNDPSLSMLLNTYSMATSVVFFVPTIILYLVVHNLRNTLPGKLQTCYLIALTVGYSTIGYINIANARYPEDKCRAIGFSGYYFFMSAYLWLGVLCFHMCKFLKECRSSNETSRETWNRFIIYSAFVWGTAGILTMIVVWAQLSKHVPETYKPGIGKEMCWLDTRKWSAALYFYLPNCLIMLFNISSFVQVTIFIYTVKRDASVFQTNRERHIQENVFMILRLFIIMGISWIMDIISYCCRKYESLDFLFGITDFCNASQGVLIFLLFICRRDVLNAITEQFGIRKRRISNRSNQMALTIQTQLSKTSTTTTLPPTPSTPYYNSLSPIPQ